MVEVLNRYCQIRNAAHLCPMATFDFDVAILGGGSAGYAAARTVAGSNLKTIVIEGGEKVGGLCILRGCMPTKALLYTAEVAHLVKHSGPFGIRAGRLSFDFKKAMARKDCLITDFAEYRRQQLQAGKFEFIRANAKFVSRHSIALSNGKTVTAKNIVIATGSVVAPSPLCQLNHLGCLNSDTALVLKKLPKSLIILGGGPTACEFAQFFARFGVKVTLVQRSPHILHDFDADAAAVVETVFVREKIHLFTGTRLLDARRNGRMKTVSFEHQGKTRTVSAEEILFALGRIPNTAFLDLPKAGVKTESNGRIITDAFMRTSSPHIFSAGDCTGPFEIVHIAVQQGEIAGRNIVANKSVRADYRLLIAVVFTEPQIAFVGMTEKEATKRNVKFLVAKYPFNDHGKSLIMNATDGFAKLLADPGTGEIIGGECVGPMAGELIHEIAAAMARRMTVRELAAMPHYHPTLAEIWTYPAEELADQIKVSPGSVRRRRRKA